jgi:CspA family cold shock protein
MGSSGFSGAVPRASRFRLSPTSFGKEWLNMATGKVKWFNDQKGFGFIAAEDNRDVFVHHTVIEGDGYKTLEDGESVEYEAEDGPKGLKALKVRRAVASHA